MRKPQTVFWGVLITVLATLFVSAGARAGDTALERPQSLLIELGGRAGLYSLQYDVHVASAVAIGGGVENFGVTGSSVWMFPLYVNAYFAPGPHRPYFTGGVNIAAASGPYTTTSYFNSTGVGSVSAGLGYEYRGSNGLLFRATAYGLVAGSTVTPWAGVSIGAALP